MATDTLHHGAASEPHEHHDATGTKVFGFWGCKFIFQGLVLFLCTHISLAVAVKLYRNSNECSPMGPF